MRPERHFEGTPGELSDWAPMTPKRILDVVVGHFHKQRRRCPTEGQCFYRFADDRCFIGALIDDEHFDPLMEGYRVKELAERFPMPNWFVANLDLIEKLQILHDHPGNWHSGVMEVQFKRLANERHLTIPA
jgi:hypothetical protein